MLGKALKVMVVMTSTMMNMKKTMLILMMKVMSILNVTLQCIAEDDDDGVADLPGLLAGPGDLGDPRRAVQDHVEVVAWVALGGSRGPGSRYH